MRAGWRMGIGLILLLTVLGAAMISYAKQPTINALSGVLMDAQTGEVIYAKNPNLCRPPASTTKIMTAIIALESGSPDQVVTVSKNAAAKEGSTVWLSVGEKQQMKDLIYGLMLASGNDAATAIAENIAGSEPKFAELMTEKAHKLGAIHTSFKNASGLPAVGHYTTAYDLALLTCYALKNPTFAQIVQTKEYSLPGNGSQKERKFYNHNKLLWRYAYADGVKTGYTQNAGKCLVSSASRNGRRLVAVVFHSKTMYEDSQTLLDYGFSRLIARGAVEIGGETPTRANVASSGQTTRTSRSNKVETAVGKMMLEQVR